MIKEQSLEIIKAALKQSALSTDELLMIIDSQLSRISLANAKIVQTVNGIIPQSLVPYTEYEIISVLNYSALPETGNVAYRYVTKEEETIGDITYPACHSYIWNGINYADITANYLLLGETETTAGRGDWNKTAYNFSQGVLLVSNEVLNNLFIGHGYTTTSTSEIFLDGLDTNTEVLSVNAISGDDNTTSTQIAHCIGGVYYRSYNATWSAWTKILTIDELSEYSKTFIADYYKSYFSSTVVGYVYTASANGRLTADNGALISTGDTVFVLGQGRKSFTVTEQGSSTTKAVLTASDISDYDFVITESPKICCYNGVDRFIRLSTKDELDSIKSSIGLDTISVQYFTETLPEFTELNGVITGDVDEILTLNGVELTDDDNGNLVFLLFPIGNRTLNGVYEITDIGSETSPFILTKVGVQDVIKVNGGDEYIKISSDSLNIEYGRLNELKKKAYYANTTDPSTKVEFFDEDGNPFTLNNGEYKELVITATSESSCYGITFGKVVNTNPTLILYQDDGDAISVGVYPDLATFTDTNTVGIISDTQKLFCIGEYETDIFWKATVVNYIK